LGYFTAFQIVYPFEAAAYNAQIGSITMPVRSSFGYHLIKVADKRPARGSVKVAHIMAMFPEKATQTDKDSAKARIDRVYAKLKNGENFENLARTYSEDRRSAPKGGELNWISVGMMIPDFEQAAFAIAKNGEYSAPIQTNFGWHIIKRLDSKPVATFEASKEMIKSKIASDARGKMADEVIIARAKKDFKYKSYPENLTPFYSVVDSSIFDNKWTVAKAAKLNKKLFVIGNKTFTQTDFATYLQNDRSPKNKMTISQLVDAYFKAFTEYNLAETFKNKLAETNSDFNNLLTEYHDGILLFNITEKQVWGKAIADSTGLQKFYEGNKDKFFWNDRVEASVFYTKDKKVAESLRTRLLSIKDKPDLSELNKALCPDTTHKCIHSTEGIYEKGDNQLVDTTNWKTGVSEIIEKDSRFNIVLVKNTRKPEPKTLSDARGLYISEYQNYLEKLWVAQLREKYKVTLDTAVLESIK
jgi:peptidyl-prolyl cis-trans isomerase SurA